MKAGARRRVAASTWAGLAFALAMPASAQMLAAGKEASFAVTSSGASFAWGGDAYGQLGFGRETVRTTPYRVADWRFVAVAMGSEHTLALRSDGTLWAWGDNTYGQLGNGSNAKSGVPVAVGSGFQALFAASSSSFGIKSDGTLWAWGRNADGQLGDGTTSHRSSPVLIGSGFVTVAPSYGCIFGIKSDGGLWRWGACVDTPGVAGPPTSTRVPIQIGTDYASAAASETHVVAIKRDGSLWSWGRNFSGELGDGTKTRQPLATQVGTGFKAAAVGFYYTIALKTDGTLWSWGTNLRGELGRSTTASSDPTPAPIGSGYAGLASGFQHTVAIKSDGTVWTWGFNSKGNLGDGTTQTGTVPKQVAAGFAAIAAGYDTSAGLRADQSLWLWGNNDSGQLLSVLPTQYVAPTRMLLDFAFIDTSRDVGFPEFHSQSFGIRSDGTLWAWGDNQFGQLGDGTTTMRPSPVQIATGFAHVAAGAHHTLAVKTDGSLWGWGSNGSGQLGTGNQTRSLVPVRIGEGYATVGARLFGSVGLKRDGTVWTWGSGSMGPLGDGVTASRNVPGIVPALTGVTAIAVAGAKTLALKADGTLWAWGDNSNGQVGDGTFTNRSTPVRVTGLSQVTAIAASLYASFALTADGSLWAWGGSVYDGVLGNGTAQLSPIPRQIGTGFVRIAGGGRHVLAMKADGTVRSWGWNLYGQLGDGGFANASIPQPIVNPSVTGYQSLTGSDASNALDPLRVLQVTGSSAAGLTSTLTDLRASGLSGDIYFTALLPPNSPLLPACQSGPCPTATTMAAVAGSPRKGTLSDVAGRSDRKTAADGSTGTAGMVVGTIGRSGFKQTGGTDYSQAESAYTGALATSGTLSLGSTTVLQNSNALICMAVTLPELSAKGQALLRSIASGSQETGRGVEQCPPVQTAATIAMFRGESSGPMTARTVTAVINPMDEDRGKVRQLYSWAVTPSGLQYMQTGPGQWEPMTEPMKPAATITVPMSGSYRHETVRAMDLSSLAGTLVFIGMGESWEQVRQLNKAGYYQTIQ